MLYANTCRIAALRGRNTTANQLTLLPQPCSPAIRNRRAPSDGPQVVAGRRSGIMGCALQCCQVGAEHLCQQSRQGPPLRGTGHAGGALNALLGLQPASHYHVRRPHACFPSCNRHVLLDKLRTVRWTQPLRRAGWQQTRPYRNVPLA